MFAPVQQQTVQEGPMSSVNPWVPATKKELVQSISSVYRGEEQRFRQMSKKQLLAIFFYLRRTRGLFN